LFLLYV